MSEKQTPARFFYTASAEGLPDMPFASSVVYEVGDELPISDGRWTVQQVEENSVSYWDPDTSTRVFSRRVYCTVSQ